MPSEFDFIAWIRDRQPASGHYPLRAGDDLAVLNWPNGLLLVGVDQVLDGVHFDSAVHAPRDIGRKAMNRNLSDCAAMGCLPDAAVVSLALPRGRGDDYAKELYLGIEAAGEPFECRIVGGDTGSWAGPLAVVVTIMGRAGNVMHTRRSGGSAGDGLYVSGPLGGSILGRHMTFEPRVFVGRRLSEANAVTAMIDLSDGLSRDVRHVCEQSKVGVTIEAALVPIHADAIALSAKDGKPPLDHALHDGEDYELLAAIEPDPAAEALAVELGMVRIGTLTAEPGVRLRMPDGRTVPLAAGAWEHSL